MEEQNYHVFVRPKGGETFRLIAKDLSERDLKKQVVKPYKAGLSSEGFAHWSPVESRKVRA